MVKSEIDDFTTLAQQQQLIKTGGYYFENLTGWLPLFDAFVMVRSREMITKDIVIKIKVLWALLQGDTGQQRPTPIELLISYSSKRYSFDCRTRTRQDRGELKSVLKPWEQELQSENNHDAQWLVLL